MVQLQAADFQKLLGTSLQEVAALLLERGATKAEDSSMRRVKFGDNVDVSPAKLPSSPHFDLRRRLSCNSPDKLVLRWP